MEIVYVLGIWLHSTVLKNNEKKPSLVLLVFHNSEIKKETQNGNQVSTES